MCLYVSVCGLGVCNERAIGGQCHHQSVCGLGVCNEHATGGPCHHQSVCGLGVCNERAIGGLCHHQSTVCSSSRRHVSPLSACDFHRHLTQDDLPS